MLGWMEFLWHSFLTERGRNESIVPAMSFMALVWRVGFSWIHTQEVFLVY